MVGPRTSIFALPNSALAAARPGAGGGVPHTVLKFPGVPEMTVELVCSRANNLSNAGTADRASFLKTASAFAAFARVLSNGSSRHLVNAGTTIAGWAPIWPSAKTALLRMYTSVLVVARTRKGDG